MKDPFTLSERVALVTGSSRGIGLELARALGAAGAIVVLNARGTDALEAAHAVLTREGLTAHIRVCDVTDSTAVEGMIESIESEIGPIEILINNAGAQHREPFPVFPLEKYRHLIEINLIAPFIVAQAACKSMIDRGSGKIINVCSVQSELGRATIAPYTATKGGLKMLTRGLCADLAPHGIQVNAIGPGYFATKLNEDLVNDADFSSWVRSRTPAGRWGQLEELGGAAVFLASDASSYINGQILYVDGGMTAVV